MAVFSVSEMLSNSKFTRWLCEDDECTQSDLLDVNAWYLYWRYQEFLNFDVT